MDLILKEDFGITLELIKVLVKHRLKKCLSKKRKLNLKRNNLAASKDKKWIQKAINPKHKGFCTPMTKATCTPKRKALAMTFKKMAKSRKGS